MRLPERLGFRGKTLWDWLQLLIVPAILIGVTFAWSFTQTRSDNAREDRRIAAARAAAEEARQDATFQGYLNQMSGLMLHEKLLSSKGGDAVRAVARTVTLTTLRRLDGERRAEVLRFLIEARLVTIKDPRVVLDGAELSSAELNLANLEGANLEGADLSDASLPGASFGAATLKHATLSYANLDGAGLEGVDLDSAQLLGTDLQNAELEKADLEGADLSLANLEKADLSGANLEGANLQDADFSHAILVAARFGGVAHLELADLRNAKNLDLGRYLTDLSAAQKATFFEFQDTFLNSLSGDELATFNLSPEKLALLRKKAGGS